jgi:hypothetical protein
MNVVRFTTYYFIVTILLLLSCQASAEVNRSDFTGTWHGKLKLLDDTTTNVKFIIQKNGSYNLIARAFYTNSQGQTNSTSQLYGLNFKHEGDSITMVFYYTDSNYAFVRLTSKNHLRVEGFTNCGWFSCDMRDAYGKLTKQ